MTSRTPTKATDLWQQVTDASPKNGSGWGYDPDISSRERPRRDIFIERFGFAVPTPNAIDAIKRHVDQRRVLEAGAGTGIWARLLSDAGVPVIAIDNRSGKYARPMKVGVYYDVGKMGAVAAVKRYRSHTALMLCWPDYDRPLAATALAAFQGDRVIYIGEGESGCTGTGRFHKMLRSGWLEVASVPIPQWPGIHDEVFLYERAS